MNYTQDYHFQSTSDNFEKLPNSIDSRKILIKNFPKDFNKCDKRQFIGLFGASQVELVGRSAVLATFSTNQTAKAVLQYLHQYPINGQLLSVEFGRNSIISATSAIENNEDENLINRNDQDLLSRLGKFSQKLNATNESLNFDEPPPPHLKYLYPKLNRDILDSICIALETSVQFYTQVLHLMNRMNLEPPFVPGTRNLKYPVEYETIGTQTEESYTCNVLARMVKRSKPDVASDESELDDEELLVDSIPDEMLNRKRKLSGPVINSKKIRSIIKSKKKVTNGEKIKKCNEDAGNRDVSDVFDNEEKFVDRNIRIVAPSTLPTLTHIENVEVINEISLETDSSIPPTSTETSVQEERLVTLTDSELRINQIPINQLDIHPLFQNYDPGKPSNKLYIKNLAKTVNETDLKRIYYRYSATKSTDECFGKDIEIRLMKTGRMKGQAFITFSDPYLEDNNFELVTRALRETNGYILQDKVMVVLYGKS